MKKYLPWIGAAGVAAGLMVVLSVMAVPAVFAQTTGTHNGWGSGGRGMGIMTRGGSAWLTASGTPAIFGTVTGVDGSTITVTQKLRPNATTSPAVYTVDASTARVFKNGTSSTVADIVQGDTVMVQGTVTDTSVVATVIRDGVGMPGKGGFGFNGRENSSSGPQTSVIPRTPAIQGNGQPVVGGNITAITGATAFTVVNTSNVTYQIDAASTTIIKNGTSSPFTSLMVGDTVIIQGPVNGSVVTASSIIDQGSGIPSNSPTRGPPAGGSLFGFFGTIGNFFKHLFGF